MESWVGVVGTLLGTVVGAGGLFLVERWRANRDDRHRFAAEKQRVYSVFLAETNRVRSSVERWLHDGKEDSLKDARDALRAALDAYAAVELVASRDVFESATNFMNSVTELADSALEPGRRAFLGVPFDSEDDDGPLKAPRDAYFNGRRAFVSAVRKQLGKGLSWDV